MKKIVEVTVLGQRIKLKSDRDVDHLQRVANLVNRKLQEMTAQGGVVSTNTQLILAALDIADDYVRSIEREREANAAVQNQIRQAVGIVDHGLAAIAS